MLLFFIHIICVVKLPVFLTLVKKTSVIRYPCLQSTTNIIISYKKI